MAEPALAGLACASSVMQGHAMAGSDTDYSKLRRDWPGKHMIRSTDPAGCDAARDELKRRYPTWTIRRSGIGRWWATTQENQLQPGWRVTVDADGLNELDELLFEQERLRGRTPEIPAQRQEPA